MFGDELKGLNLIAEAMEKNVSIARAVEIAVESSTVIPQFEEVSLADAGGRILSQPIHSKVDDPRFDNSAMDGWAVRYSDCNTQPTTLQVIDTIQAGDSSDVVVLEGTACRIMTGAPVPAGADAIVMVEDSSVEDGQVTITGPARPSYIRRRGENITKGELGLHSGSVLGPAEVALAAMMGYATLPLLIPPRVAIIGTGDELVEPGEPLEAGQIYESNTAALSGLVKKMGCEPVRYSFETDDLDKLRKLFDLAASECDFILTSGGVSMGEWDLVRRLMEEEGDMRFWRVLIKPGGPPLFGLWKDTPLFGLPGNPVSSQVVFMMVVSPWIAECWNHDDKRGPKLFERVRVKLLDDARGAKRKVTLRRVFIRVNGDELVAEVPDNQGSGNLRSMVDCNGLTLLPIGVDGSRGEVVDALWLR